MASKRRAIYGDLVNSKGIKKRDGGKRNRVIYVWLWNYDSLTTTQDDSSEPENPITITLPELLPTATFAFVTVNGVDVDADDEIGQ